MLEHTPASVWSLKERGRKKRRARATAASAVAEEEEEEEEALFRWMSRVCWEGLELGGTAISHASCFPCILIQSGCANTHACQQTRSHMLCRQNLPGHNILTANSCSRLRPNPISYCYTYNLAIHPASQGAVLKISMSEIGHNFKTSVHCKLSKNVLM